MIPKAVAGVYYKPNYWWDRS